MGRDVLVLGELYVCSGGAGYQAHGCVKGAEVTDPKAGSQKWT